MIFWVEVRGTHCSESHAALQEIAVAVTELEAETRDRSRRATIDAKSATDATERVKRVLAPFPRLRVEQAQYLGSYQRRSQP